jgi:hypothetical protein
VQRCIRLDFASLNGEWKVRADRQWLQVIFGRRLACTRLSAATHLHDLNLQQQQQFRRCAEDGGRPTSTASRIMQLLKRQAVARRCPKGASFPPMHSSSSGPSTGACLADDRVALDNLCVPHSQQP